MNWMIQKQERHDVPLLASVSINVESILHHAQRIGTDVRLDPVPLYAVALPRILAFLDRLQVRATFFVVAKDLYGHGTVECLEEVVARGHEVASYSYSAPGNLRKWSKLSVAEEIEQASDAIFQAVGKLPSGFRTPGYNVDTRILQLLAERGYKYDASVLPSLPYYLARGRTAVMSSFIRGMHDRTRIAARSLRAPLQPYRPSRWAFWQAGDRKHSLPIWEIPHGVMRGTGIPMTGAFIARMPPSTHDMLYRMFRQDQHVLHLTLHAVDFVDEHDAELSHALRHIQKSGVKIPKDVKEERLVHFIRFMQQEYRMVPLEELADALSSLVGPTVLV